MPANRLFLVRHGQTASNVAQTLGASHDDPLDPVGEAQARAVAAHFARLDLPTPAVYASPFRRAGQTAAAIADALAVPVTVLPGIQEIEVGPQWHGRPYAHLISHVHEIDLPGGAFGFAGGETLEEVADRFLAALRQPLARGQLPIVVSHGGALTAALARLLGQDIRAVWQDPRYTHANTALTQLERHGNGWQLARLADAAHLESKP
ncbi:histidine phosphatase family protein [Deinococcus sp. MIMF12]|uniref:Histidine phosphatase family protein n=1 Tax=Deinococcus rhizophilus TaxID=3049544 RepID=A0ABT7JFY2_9DEIO|nr:histidine phosphatase family protein [Deinococcus rhizophilus]MDL2343856.1 histidine phosphatase family protein [Deinococcus rhizophilus]